MSIRHRFEDLPRILPIFPLSGVVLLPGGLLPLNVFEPRYLAMIDDALGWSRLVGMIQPLVPEDASPAGAEPPLYETGCVGRINQFTETEDGRYVITLTGVCRFHVDEEAAVVRGYRRITPDWTPFRGDLEDDTGEAPEAEIDRPRLLAVLKTYGRLQGMELNWKAVEGASDRALTTSLPMACPFQPSEKQALLECPDVASRAATLITLMEMAVAEGAGRQNLVKQ